MTSIRKARQAQPDLPNCGKSTHLWALLPALALGVSPVWAGDRAPAASPIVRRSLSAQPVPTAALGATRSPETQQPPTRVAQLGSHGRYSFGQFRGGYRYPFSYPYYRYGGSRLYPFGVGPYGPYGSNYGGYSGNAYDPRVYGRPPMGGQQQPDAPPPADDAPPASAAPPAGLVPPASAPQSDPGTPEAGPVLSPPALASPGIPQGAGPTVPYFGYFGGDPFNPTYGGAQAFRAYPFGYYGEGMWFGLGRTVYGFGYYPNQIYPYQYGPPSGLGYYNPAFPPQYGSFNVRNYGPAYPTPGGINGGPGYYYGW